MLKQQQHICRSPLTLAIAVLASSGPSLAMAAQLLDNEHFQIRWDNTVKYQVGQRTEAPSSFNKRDININDGTQAFNKHDLITNRLDILSEFDLTLKDAANSGLRISAAAWYDNVYNRDHRRIPAASYNMSTVDNDEFSAQAKDQAGRDVELLDAFIHSGIDLNGHYLSGRLGRHTLLWGESLFLATNGIGHGQAPNDAYKALSVPSTLAKEVFLPVNQLSMALSLTDSLSVEGYYQFEYQQTRVAAPGTYWSVGDMVFKGGENLLLAPGVGVPRGRDIEPREHSGQWGVALKYRDYENDWDYGAYFLRYHAKTPQVFMHLSTVAPGVAVPDEYQFVYPEDIKLFGLSASTKIGDANVAGEVSFRDNVPLVSDATKLVIVDDQRIDGRNNPGYAVGQTIHAQVSAIWVLPRASLWDNSELAAELGANHLYKVTKNDERRDKDNTVRTAAGFRGTFTPTWYQALPSVDLSAPITLGYNFTGKSPVDAGFNVTGAAHGGDLTAALNFKYAGNLRGGISYTTFLGADDNNAYHDRDFVLLNLAYSF
ncbi:DUF1302 domain-containing protein [Pseudomonas aeruginosa]|uniref:DUF1302 domain-containing protein n=1 Tax=Pseudomonas aeruginosa TaxID=287 RepID=UPI003FA69000